MRNYKKRYTIVAALLVLVVTLSLLFVACGGKQFNDYPEHPGTGKAVTSNGGVVVNYGDYLYYVNGQQSSNTVTNEYTGEVELGNIVRIKVSDIPELFSFRETHIDDDDDYAENLQKEVFERAELVVPKVAFYGNTTDTETNGLFIYNEKIYYTSPNSTRSVGGDIQYNQLCIYSCDLDGRNNKKLHTIDSASSSIFSNQVAISMDETTKVVTAMYVDMDSQLVTVDLSSANNKPVVVHEKVASLTHHFEERTVVFVDDLQYTDEDEEVKNADYQSICYYTVGDEKYSVMHSPKLDEDDEIEETLTIGQSNFWDGKLYVYFSITSTSADDTSHLVGTWLVLNDGEEATRLVKHEISTTYTFYQRYAIITHQDTQGAYRFRKVSFDDDQEVVELVAAGQLHEAPTVVSIKDDTLTITAKLFAKDSEGEEIPAADTVVWTYDIDLSEAYPELVQTHLPISGTGWYGADKVEIKFADSDKIETVFFTINAGEVKVLRQVYNDEDEKDEYISVDIFVLKPEEDEDED